MLFWQRARGGTGLAAGWRVEGRMVGGGRSTPRPPRLLCTFRKSKGPDLALQASRLLGCLGSAILILAVPGRWCLSSHGFRFRFGVLR